MAEVLVPLAVALPLAVLIGLLVRQRLNAWMAGSMWSQQRRSGG